MSDSESGKLDELTSRIKEVVAGAESHLDTEGLLHRIRESASKAGSTIDTDAIMGRFKEVAGQAEGKIDGGKLRQRVADVDRDKLRGWLGEAQHLGADAVSLIGTQGEKLAGAAKEKLGTITGDQGLISEGQIERVKGQLKETIASVSEMAESRTKDVAETVKTKLDEETRRE
jgi:uncharacterized protein YjbJ (UPF0337 family)